MRSGLVRIWFRALHWLKALLAAILPTRLWLWLTRLLGGRLTNRGAAEIFAEAWRRSRIESRDRPRRNVAHGINVVGYLRAAKGIGEAARRSLVAAAAGSIPHSAVDYEVGVTAGILTETDWATPQTGFCYNANLLHVNPPQLPFLWAHYSPAELALPFTVGIWYWELPVFPAAWRSAFSLVDEIWAGSRFVQDCLAAESPVPVVLIPPCISPSPTPQTTRQALGLPEHGFLFLCAYDFLSSEVRKNPIGAIRAFKQAFPVEGGRACLIVKVINSAYNPSALKALRQEASGRSDILVLDMLLDRGQMSALLNLVDCYVSLHRAEGFGLIAAEAMYLGKPVVMTRWSGNADYMTSDNSCGVDYALVPVGPGAEPYGADAVWAEPDVAQAAEYLRRLSEDRPFYNAISTKASQTIRQDYSPLAIGGLMRRRLEQVGVLV